MFTCGKPQPLPHTRPHTPKKRKTITEPIGRPGRRDLINQSTAHVNPSRAAHSLPGGSSQFRKSRCGSRRRGRPPRVNQPSVFERWTQSADPYRFQRAAAKCIGQRLSLFTLSVREMDLGMDLGLFVLLAPSGASAAATTTSSCSQISL